MRRVRVLLLLLMRWYRGREIFCLGWSGKKKRKRNTIRTSMIEQIFDPHALPLAFLSLVENKVKIRRKNLTPRDECEMVSNHVFIFVLLNRLLEMLISRK